MLRRAAGGTWLKPVDFASARILPCRVVDSRADDLERRAGHEALRWNCKEVRTRGCGCGLRAYGRARGAGGGDGHGRGSAPADVGRRRRAGKPHRGPRDEHPGGVFGRPRQRPGASCQRRRRAALPGFDDKDHDRAARARAREPRRCGHGPGGRLLAARRGQHDERLEGGRADHGEGPAGLPSAPVRKRRGLRARPPCGRDLAGLRRPHEPESRRARLQGHALCQSLRAARRRPLHHGARPLPHL